MISRILSAEYVADADGVSYFYQIPLDPEVRDYFGCRLAGGRGLFRQMRFCSLPMGFSWAPGIAQRIANVIIADHGIAWVDNFFVLGTSLDDFAEHRDAFLSRADAANLLLDDHVMASRGTRHRIRPCREPISDVPTMGLEGRHPFIRANTDRGHHAR